MFNLLRKLKGVMYKLRGEVLSVILDGCCCSFFDHSNDYIDFDRFRLQILDACFIYTRFVGRRVSFCWRCNKLYFEHYDWM